MSRGRRLCSLHSGLGDGLFKMGTRPRPRSAVAPCFLTRKYTSAGSSRFCPQDHRNSYIYLTSDNGIWYCMASKATGTGSAMAARGEVSLTATRALMEPRMSTCMYMFGGTIGKCWPDEMDELDEASVMF